MEGAEGGGRERVEEGGGEEGVVLVGGGEEEEIGREVGAGEDGVFSKRVAA